MSHSPAPTAGAPFVRKLGRFELRELLGRSVRCMAWRALDPRSGQLVLLVLPRQQPDHPAALEAWLDQARRGARLAHPGLAQAVEVGAQDHWPYIAYDGAIGPTLTERRVPPEGESGADIARWMAQALDGLAFAHDAGLVRDRSATILLICAPVMTLEVARVARDVAVTN